MPTVRAPPERASGRYLAATFDAQAASFDHELGKLQYAVPEQLQQMLASPRFGGAARRFRAMLDLGCGTGLVAPLWEARADALAGTPNSNPNLTLTRTRTLALALTLILTLTLALTLTLTLTTLTLTRWA